MKQVSAHKTDYTIQSLGEKKILLTSAVVALVIELSFLFGIALNGQGFFHSPRTPEVDDKRFLEAEFFEVPPPSQAHLTEVKTKSIPKPILGKSIAAKTPDQNSAVEEQNETQEGKVEEIDHGPIAFYAPSPLIPAYLRQQELKTSVGIVFYVTSLGAATSRLVRSSGNEELDAIALETVKKWQFRPALKSRIAVDSKVSLKIVFEVD